MKEAVPDRLAELEELFRKRKNQNNQLCWIRYNPVSEFGYDIEDATEDIEWMIHEIRRLRDENAHLQEFADSYRKDLHKDING